MKIKPKENFILLGTDIRLSKKKKYKATPANNIPDFSEKGAIFVKGVLLYEGEYKIVKP